MAKTDQTVKIYSAANEIDAGIIMELLQNNNIPSYKKSKGSGGYMSIYMGYSIYGEDIYINEQDFKKAMYLINELSINEPIINKENKDNDDNENDKQNVEVDGNLNLPFYKNPAIITRIIFICILCIYIFVYFIKKFT